MLFRSAEKITCSPLKSTDLIPTFVLYVKRRSIIIRWDGPRNSSISSHLVTPKLYLPNSKKVWKPYLVNKRGWRSCGSCFSFLNQTFASGKLVNFWAFYFWDQEHLPTSFLCLLHSLLILCTMVSNRWNTEPHEMQTKLYYFYFVNLKTVSLFIVNMNFSQ